MFKRFGWSLVCLAFTFLSGCSDLNISSGDVEIGQPSFDLAPMGMAKPISQMRDYDGTFTGTPGTGTSGYTTLWRDNYTGSPCHGEGCGGHPGVDVVANSNTAVYAARGGRVVTSTCNWNGSRTSPTGWGGLVVIKSDHPHTPGISGDSVYFTYAHLNKWDYYSVGQAVATGAQIGLSGGNLQYDVCPGSSTGPHLHFQIDKDNGGTVPYFPSNVNTPDGNNGYAVANETYNPVVMIWGGYRWTFWQAALNGQFKEYWTSDSNTTLSVTNDGLANTDEALVLNSGTDPWIWRGNGYITCEDKSGTCGTQIAVEAAYYSKVSIDMNRVGCYANPVKVYFITNSSPSWDEAKSVSVYPSSAAYSHINMAVNSYWTGIVTGLRIDPSVNCNPRGNIYIGHITIERSDH